jgi:hypothetical protein
MLTQSSAKWVSESLYENQNGYYTKKEAAYYSGKRYGGSIRGFSFAQGVEGTILAFFGAVARPCREGKSNKSLSGVCNDERNKREIQAVKCTKLTVIDHTFSALSNYQSLLGAKAIFTQGVDGGQVSLVVLVDNTAIQEVSHAIKQCAHRSNFRPFIISSDTFPKLFDFFKLIFGATIMGQLGLFHFMHRLTKCMRTDHPDYWRVVQEVQGCLYQRNGKDERMVIGSLSDGSMSGKKTLRGRNSRAERQSKVE